MIIIGAGMSGLLCGALNAGSIIYEANPKGTENHKAVFRCRKTELAKVLGLDFKKVTVYKAIWLDGKERQPSPRIAHLYSKKVTGQITGRSVLDISSCVRYIPPVDFKEQLEKRCSIKYNTPFHFEEKNTDHTPIISTIPMPGLLSSLGINYPVLLFKHHPIITNRIPVPDCDSHCTVYYPSPEMNSYRASITGDMLIVEGVGPLYQKELDEICYSLGVDFSRQMMNHVKNTPQKMGKIFQVNKLGRQKIITDLTLKKGIYSLGRFATWRPKVMLDDVLLDIYHIRRLIQGGNYAALNHKQNEEN